MKKMLLLVVVLTLGLATTAQAKPKPGQLDPTFGRGGKVLVTRSIGGFPWYSKTALLAKLPGTGAVVLLENELFAFQGDGRRDRRFGGGDLEASLPGAPSVGWNDIAVDPSGRLVLAGQEYKEPGSPYTWSQDDDLVLARFSGNGSLDPTFGTGGVVRTDFGSPFNGTGQYSWVSAPAISNLDGLTIDSSGRLLLSGLGATEITSCKDPVVFYDAYLARLLDDGEFDPTFGEDGRVEVPGSRSTKPPLPTSSGTIYLLDTEGPCGSRDSRLSAWDENGASDSSFGGTGIVTLGRHEAAAAVDRADRLVVAEAGYGSRRQGMLLHVRRFLPDGQIDRGFGLGGIAKMPLPAGSGFIPSAVAVERSGKIVVAGTAWPTGHSKAPRRFLVARFTAGGKPDPAFGRRGQVLTSFGRRSEAVATDMTLVKGGILVAGPVSRPSLFDGKGLALVRYRSR